MFKFTIEHSNYYAKSNNTVIFARKKHRKVDFLLFFLIQVDLCLNSQLNTAKLEYNEELYSFQVEEKQLAKNSVYGLLNKSEN